MAAGILNLDKPKGWTSHDVVAAVRRLTRAGKVGHAGTLDPMATGVLLVCVGYASRLSEFLQGHDKTYRATVRFGVSTDTYDAEGAITQTRPLPPLADAALLEATRCFIGEFDQMPPVYAAIKQAGVPQHRRARRGEAVQVTARRARVDALDIVDWRPPYLTITVTCSAGTYIRSLAHDMGEHLGCGGHLTALARLASGPFALLDACSWEMFQRAVRQGWWQTLLHPPAAALSGFVALPVSPEMRQLLAQGRPVTGPAATDGTTGYAHTADGQIVALLRYDPDLQRWQPYKVFDQEQAQ